MKNESLTLPREFLPSLTSLRFFAAFIVIIQHYTYRDLLFPAQLFLGYEAVTFFFVLSGFILTYAHAPETSSEKLAIRTRDFIAARAARILPVYYFALIVALPWYFYRLATESISIEEFIYGAVLVLFLVQSWVPHFSLYWNDPSWSLSVEAIFYLSYTILWNWARSYSDKAVFSAALLLVAALGIMRYLFLDASGDSLSANHFSLYFPLLHLPQFILGFALGRIFIYQRALVRKYAMPLLAIAVIGLTLLICFHTSVPFLRNSAVVAIICGAIILSFANPPCVLGWRPFSGRLLTVLGEASYAMYILHYPLLLWFGLITRSVGIALPIWLDFIIYLTFVIAVSVLIFYMIERPMRRWITRALLKSY